MSIEQSRLLERAEAKAEHLARDRDKWKARAEKNEAILKAAQEVAKLYSPVYPPNGTGLGRAIGALVEIAGGKDT